MATTFAGFPKETIPFLRSLAAHNERGWFEANKHRYESDVREPALAFIAAMEPELVRISPHFDALAKKTGGSLMRIYRDTRFSRNKAPYKTNIGIQFRHERGKDVHAPGFYFHIDPDECFIGAGVWHPDAAALGKIREAIAATLQAEAGASTANSWLAARNHAAFTAAGFTLQGDALKRAPKGYPVDHPLIEDLKRKDFIAIADLDTAEITRPDLPARVAKRYAAAAPLVRFLCDALELDY